VYDYIKHNMSIVVKIGLQHIVGLMGAQVIHPCLQAATALCFIRMSTIYMPLGNQHLGLSHIVY
jgi:hypothetical protein